MQIEFLCVITHSIRLNFIKEEFKPVYLKLSLPDNGLATAQE